MVRLVFFLACVSMIFITQTKAGGILDSIKNAFGFGSSATSSVINSNSASISLPNYFRIEGELLRLDNIGGIKSNGGSCDTVGQCDSVVYAYVDTLNATGPFPGARPLETIPQVFELADVNSPKINTMVSADVCNKELTKATLRVHVMDRNKLFTDSLISNFDCYISGNVGRSVQDAKWSSAGSCVGKYMPDKIKLIFRSRIYRIDPKQCSETVIPPTTTAGSFFD